MQGLLGSVRGVEVRKGPSGVTLCGAPGAGVWGGRVVIQGEDPRQLFRCGSALIFSTVRRYVPGPRQPQARSSQTLSPKSCISALLCPPQYSASTDESGMALLRFLHRIHGSENRNILNLTLYPWRACRWRWVSVPQELFVLILLTTMGFPRQTIVDLYTNPITSAADLE